MSNALTNLDAIAKAKLPQTYEAAKTALSRCSEIDECQDWADKAEALASYARQAGDDSLRRTADRIQARAIKRCGDLLKAIEAKHTGRPPEKIRTGTDTNLIKPPTRTNAASEAGLSKRQKDTALRVASIPEEEFEAAVEAYEPPTVTELAERGKKPREKPIEPRRNQRDVEACGEAVELIRALWMFSQHNEIASIVLGSSPAKREALLANIPVLIEWLHTLAAALTGSDA